MKLNIVIGLFLIACAITLAVCSSGPLFLGFAIAGGIFLGLDS